MYCKELFDLPKDIKDISGENFYNIDNFFGAIGNGAVFTYSDFKKVVSQKSLVGKILQYLLEKDVIGRYRLLCPSCGGENNVKTALCENCGEKISSEEISQSIFKILCHIEKSYEEKRLSSGTVNAIDLHSFKILKGKIDRMKFDEAEGTIVFFDIANSTEMDQENITISTKIKKAFNQYTKRLIQSYFYSYEGIYIKGEGDSAWLFFVNQDVALRFLREYFKNKEDEFFTMMREYNRNAKYPVYLKTYIASSTIESYTQTDMLSIDFNVMEAFVFISRIEKSAKKTIIDIVPNQTKLFPGYIVSRIENGIYPTRIPLELTEIPNYKTVKAFAYFVEDIPELTSNP